MLRQEILRALEDIPIVDVHSHMSRDRLAARSAESVVFYHMLKYPLRTAGMPPETLWAGSHHHRVTDEAYRRLPEFWPRIANTSFGWVLGRILADLYDLAPPTDRQAVEAIRSTLDAAAARPDWGREVLAQGRVETILSSRYHGQGPDPGGLPRVLWTVERAPINQPVEHTGWLRRLESINEPRPERVEKYGGPLVLSETVVRSLDDLQNVVEEYLGRIDWTDKRAYVQWISSRCDFRPTPPEHIDRILAAVRAGEDLTPEQAGLLDAAYVRCLCRSASRRVGIVQLCYGMQQITPADEARYVQRASSELAESLGFLVDEFPEVHFNLLNGYEGDEPALCGLALAYPNVSLASFWWQTFYPSVMHAAWRRRLEMLPVSALCGFFSDGYCADWVYGRAVLTRHVLAGVLAERVDEGYDTVAQAVEIARRLLQETPAERMGLASPGGA